VRLLQSKSVLPCISFATCDTCFGALQLPQPAALYHNDCQHIGNQMLSLPYIYAPKLAQLAPSAPAQLIDAAQRLKEAGSAVLAAQVCYITFHDNLLSECLCLTFATIRYSHGWGKPDQQSGLFQPCQRASR